MTVAVAVEVPAGMGDCRGYGNDWRVTGAMAGDGSSDSTKDERRGAPCDLLWGRFATTVAKGTVLELEMEQQKHGSKKNGVLSKYEVHPESGQVLGLAGEPQWNCKQPSNYVFEPDELGDRRRMSIVALTGLF